MFGVGVDHVAGGAFPLPGNFHSAKIEFLTSIKSLLIFIPFLYDTRSQMSF